MNSKLKNLFINSDALQKVIESNKKSSTPYKGKDVKTNTSSKSKVKTIGRRIINDKCK